VAVWLYPSWARALLPRPHAVPRHQAGRSPSGEKAVPWLPCLPLSPPQAEPSLTPPGSALSAPLKQSPPCAPVRQSEVRARQGAPAMVLRLGAGCGSADGCLSGWRSSERRARVRRHSPLLAPALLGPKMRPGAGNESAKANSQGGRGSSQGEGALSPLPRHQRGLLRSGTRRRWQ